MHAMSIRLAPLRPGDESDARAAHAELAQEDFEFLLGIDGTSGWSDYLDALAGRRCGRRLEGGFVPSTFLGAYTDGTLVGRTSIRHELNEFLAREGGHIGFAIRSPYRRRGFATEVLWQSLVVARSVGVDRVLVTCDDDNHASAAVIERCGGSLADVVQPDGGGTPLRRYWID